MANEKTTKLSDVLKGSQEVSSLGGNDRLVAIDADGSTKKIKKERLFEEGRLVQNVLNTEGWYNIAKFRSNATHFVTFQVGTQWNHTQPMSALIHMMICGNNVGGVSLGVVSTLRISTKTIQKVRVVYTGSEMLLDFYYGVSVNNNVVIQGIAGIELNSEIKKAELLDGWTTKEFDISNSGGGGNFLQFNVLPLQERRSAA